MENLQITVTAANPLPIYRQVGEQMKEYIRTHSLCEGTLLPNVRTLASLAGVSLKTADKAFSELVKEGVCFRRPKKGTYVGKIARVPTKAVCGVYHAQHLTSFENDLVQAAIYRGFTIHDHKHQVDPFFITGDAQETISFYLRQEALNLKGVVLLQWENLKEATALAERFPDIRFVHLNYDLDGFADGPANLYGVFNDDFGGAYQMTEYLISKGHRHIAALTMELNNENFRQRAAGYKRALENNHLRFERELLHSIRAEGNMGPKEAGYSLAARLAESGREVTAVFCMNDLMVAGAMEYFKTHTQAVPMEFAGYDDVIPQLSKDHNFSTVHVEFEQMGTKAVEILNNPAAKYPKVLRIAPHLLIRN